jgi:ABC-type polysaccharide/polyol phosphate transport system ATPase subunit
MARNVIEVEGLSKRYRLGEYHGLRFSARDALSEAAGRLLHRAPAKPPQELWALRDISFSVAEGDTLGFVGRNGAGKTTVLKIITRITEPTAGVSRARGRVGSLLEVGTGFHPELTGRENVYLNGAILGMGRREIERRFEEIAVFAGVERFLDTPVKRYSSGMYLRLAFSVAAHLDAEILLVDEVLAVGDAAFQRKCLGRMGSLQREGRTVLFVSHNLDAIMRLCRTSVWLDGGAMRAYGPTADVVAAYLAAGTTSSARRTYAPQHGKPVQLREVRLLDASGQETSRLPPDRPFTIEVRFAVMERVPGLDLTVFVQNLRGTRVLDEAWADASPDRNSGPGEYIARVSIPPLLAAGDYIAGLWIGSAYETILHEDDVLHFGLEGGGNGRAERILKLGLPWDVRRVDAARGEPAP